MSTEAKEQGLKSEPPLLLDTMSTSRFVKQKRMRTTSILYCSRSRRIWLEEALLLDTEGYVAEGSGENIFIVRNQTLYTPELTSCLDGITRRPFSNLQPKKAMRSSKNAFLVMKLTSPMRLFLQEPLLKSYPSAC